MTNIHRLKTINPYFTQVLSGQKSYELRYNDRLYQVGDLLILREYNKDSELFSGREIAASVDSILHDFDGLQLGYVIMSITPIYMDIQIPATRPEGIDLKYRYRIYFNGFEEVYRTE